MKNGCDSARGTLAGAASLRPYKGTADSHEEGVEALRFTLTHRSHKTAADLLDDLDGADAIRRAHLVLMAEAEDKAFVAVHAALPPGAPVKRRLGKELRQVA